LLLSEEGDKNSIRCYCDVAHVISTNYKTAFNKYDSVLREAAPRRALYAAIYNN